MFLIYTDEAGNTGCKKDRDQPIHMIGALIVHAEQVRPVNDAVSEILARFAPNSDLQALEIHGISFDHPHQLAFGFLAERLQSWLDEQESLGLIIANENHEVQQPVIQAMRDFQSIGWRFGGVGKPMKRIIDTVHFVRSIDNRVLQLADLVTYLLCKAQRLRDSITKQSRELKPSDELILRLDRKIRQRLVFSRIFPRQFDI